MSRRKQPRVSRELQDAAAERWRERMEADAESRKPPVTTGAQRDDLFAVAATLRAEVEKNVLAAVQSQTDALGGLLKLEAIFGQPPTPLDSVQPAHPPAFGWRSMASAPKNSSSFLGIVTKCGTIPIVEIGYVCDDGRHFQAGNNCQYVLHEMLAWAPIPEWTGEVAD